MGKRLTTDEERKRVNFIVDRAKKMQAAKQRYSKRWEAYERIWKFFEEERTGEDAWRENLPDTWAYATIKTAQAAFTDSKVSPVFTRHEDEDMMKPRDLKDLYDDIAEKGSIDFELYFARLDVFKLGTGFLKTCYLEDKRKVQNIEKFNPDTDTFTYKEKDIKDFDDPISLRVSPYMMLVDEMAKADFDSTARDCIEMEILDYEEAKRKYGHYIENWDNRVKKAGAIKGILKDLAKRSVATTSDELTRDVHVQDFQFFAPLELGDNNVEILHYWSKNMGVKGTDTYELVINGEPIFVDTARKPAPIPYIHKRLPYTPILYSPYSGDEFWAAGIIEIAYSEIKSLRKNREMMSDRQKLSLFSPAFSDVNDEIDQRTLKLQPLSVIRTRGGVPQYAKIPGITESDLALQDRAEESLKRAVGIDERVLGVSPEGGQLTATEVSFLREAALRRLREFAFLYKRALLREVRMKLKLFEQYFSSPFIAEERIKSDSGVKRLKVQAKRFKVKLDNTYTNKEVYRSMLEGDIDIDIDMRILVPLTQAQMITKWAQVLRDVAPFVMQGLVDLDLGKVIEEYLDALEVNVTSLRRDEDAEAVKMAEGEHKLLASKNTSRAVVEQILPNGTALEFLNATHIQRHQELLAGDDSIGQEELRNLAQHIAKDVDNLKKKMMQDQAQQMQMAQQMMQGQQGKPGQPPQGPQPQPAPTQPGQLQVGEGLGLV